MGNRGRTGFFRALLRNERGAFAVLAAGATPMLIGLAALGVETGIWFADRRALQTAADAAALGAAFEMYLGAADLTAAASFDAARNGFVAGKDGTLTVTSPPTAGAFAGDASAVEVVLNRPENLVFARLLLPSLTLAARAVGRATKSDSCILSLDPSASPGVGTQGNAKVRLYGCGVTANSTSNQAIKAGGSSSLTADFLSTPGNYSGSVTVGHADTGAPAAADPFAALAVPSFGSCDHTNFSTDATTTLSPGVYCNGMSFGAHAKVTLSPGVYIVNGGTFSANGGASVTGTGVTIILTGATPGAVATMNINGGASFNLAAATTGPFAGVVVFQDRKAATSGTNTMNGNASTVFTGAIYFPRQTVNYSGGTNNTNGCTRIIARVISLSGDAALSDQCAGTGLPMSGQPPSVVE